LPTERATAHHRTVLSAVELNVAAPEYASGDEELLRLAGVRVRVALLNERCVSFGVRVDENAPYLRRAAAERIPTVARRTGGTGLLHERGDLAWTVVLPRDDPRVGTAYTRAYARLGRGPVRWLADRGIDASWAPAPGVAPEYCTLGDRGSVLSASGRILGGAAQHVAGSGLLHHGTVSMTVDRAAIDRLFGLPDPSPSARLGGVRELGVRGPAPDLARALAEAIASDLSTD
jgi:lipoate-protein ligase A